MNGKTNLHLVGKSSSSGVCHSTLPLLPSGFSALSVSSNSHLWLKASGQRWRGEVTPDDLALLIQPLERDFGLPRDFDFAQVSVLMLMFADRDNGWDFFVVRCSYLVKLGLEFDSDYGCVGFCPQRRRMLPHWEHSTGNLWDCNYFPNCYFCSFQQRLDWKGQKLSLQGKRSRMRVPHSGQPRHCKYVHWPKPPFCLSFKEYRRKSTTFLQTLSTNPKTRQVSD